MSQECEKQALALFSRAIEFLLTCWSFSIVMAVQVL
jgi:hypothetical protein